MSATSFDTMEAAEALTRAGLPEPQAKAIAITVRKAVSEGVATKSDVGELRTELKGDIGELRAELKGDIGELRTELKGDIGELKGDIGELKGDIGELRGEVGAVKAELWAVKWVLGFMFAIVLAMAARLFGVV